MESYFEIKLLSLSPLCANRSDKVESNISKHINAHDQTNFEQLFYSSNIPYLLKLDIFSNLFQNNFKSYMYIFKKYYYCPPPPLND